MKIFISGSDNIGWSIDQDRKFLEASIKRIGGTLANSPFHADIVHNIWWNIFLGQKKMFYYSNRRVLLTASNFLNEEAFKKPSELLKKALKLSINWIAPSTKQKDVFEKNHIKAHYLPFQVAHDFFTVANADENKNYYLENLKVPKELTAGRKIIGSFQRDSLGTNLEFPKEQKGPEILVEILKEMPRNKFLLLLAGPRRHYVIKKCREHSIPFYYLGKECSGDDLIDNAIPYNQMKYLYKAIDFYMVTSRSEGGPKAILEGAATGTTVLSTDVGHARDVLSADNIFSDVEAYKKCVFALLNEENNFESYHASTISECTKKINFLCNTSIYDKTLSGIYEKMMRKTRFFVRF